jgi:hypothetical protein
VIVAPADATIFSEQAFAFAQDNASFVTAILGRSLADGGGNSFYNLAPPGGPDARGWMTIEGDFLNARDPASHPAFRDTAGGVEAGADLDIGGGARIGLAAGYEGDRLTDSDGGSGSQSVARVSAYGSLTAGQIGLSAALAYDYAWIDTDRASGFGISSSNRRADALTGAVQAATAFTLADVVVTPSAGVLLAHQGAGGFAETNALSAAFAVTGQPQSLNTVAPFVKVGVSHSYDAGGGLTLVPDAELGYRYDAAAAGEAFTLYAGDGTPFYGNRVALDRDSLTAGASVTGHQGPWTFFVKYRAAVAGNWNWQSIGGGVRMTF